MRPARLPRGKWRDIRPDSRIRIARQLSKEFRKMSIQKPPKKTPYAIQLNN